MMSQLAHRLSTSDTFDREPESYARLKALAARQLITERVEDIASVTDFGGFMSILSRNAARIALIAAAFLGLALTYLATAKPIYSATTSIFIDPRSRKLLPDELVQSNLGSDLVLVESQLAIISSDGVLKRVVEKLKPTEDPEFNAGAPQAGVIAKIKDFIRGPRETVSDETRALLALSEAVKVKRAQKTYVVEVEVSSSSPVKATRLSEAVVAAYMEDQAAAKAAEIRNANKLIDDRLDELRVQLRDAETRVDEFKKANKILTSEGGLVTEQQLTRLSGELITARAVAAESKARVELVQSALKDGGSPEYLPDAIRSGLIQKLREQFAQVARREAALSSQLQARHPVLIEVRSQQQEIKSQINDELKRIASSAKSDLQFANIRVDELTRSLEAAKADVSRTNTAQIRLRELEQDVTTSRDLLNTFLARAKQTQEQQALTLAEARVISPASVPTRPSKPITWLILLLGTMGGLGLGIAYALVRDLRQAGANPVTTRDAKLTERHTIPVAAARMAATQSESHNPHETLGSLPDLGTGGGIGRLLKPRGWTDHIGLGDLVAALDEPDGTPNQRAFRQAVLRLLSRLRSDHRNGTADIIVMASGVAGAGVSTAAVAVAYAARLSGERVLLIDANSNDMDLSEALAADFEHRGLIVLDNVEHLRSITRHDAPTDLSFLPIALADLRVLRTHQRKRLAAGVASLAQSYDLVVIDAGAVLDDESATALMPVADQIVLVSRQGGPSAQADRELQRMIAPYRESVVGTLVNMHS